MCEECYSDNNRETPLLNAEDCLRNHVQYICGTCGRCICIDRDEKRNVQRWNFPFKDLYTAKLYLRTADHTVGANCGIYEIRNEKGRSSFKIFRNDEEMLSYLKKNKGKYCPQNEAVYRHHEFRSFHGTQVRRLSEGEIRRYISEKYSGSVVHNEAD